MRTQNLSIDAVIKLKWTARIICVLSGLAILIWFGMVLYYNSDFSYVWILVLTAYPIAALTAWRWSLTGGIIAALLSSLFIYVTFIEVHLYINNDYIYPVLALSTVAIWLFLGFLFLIGAIMHITQGIWKQKNRGTSFYRIISGFIKEHRCRLIIGCIVFLAIAGFSFTIGSTIIRYLIQIPEAAPVRRDFNRFFWLPYTRDGVLPWDEKGTWSFQETYWGSHLLFILSVLWWAFLSFVIVILGSFIYGRYIKKR